MKKPNKIFLEKFLSPKQTSAILFFLLISLTLFSQAQGISGLVKDKNNEPLIGANVVIQGTTTGTVTNVDGKFSLDQVSPDAFLEFSLIGYTKQVVEVNGRTSITVTLEEDVQSIDEVVVVGFGTQKKVNVTGAVSSVTAETFENKPVANIGQALQGVVPNLNVNISSGSPNATPSFNIRGGTSMYYNTDTKKYQVSSGSPLILVDGIEMTASLINQMNPNDIESMSVIKDASAAAIYGTKATFGVILITTKTGKFNQEGKISYSYDISWDTPSAMPDILDSYTIQKAEMDKTVWTGGSIGDATMKKLEAMQKYLDNPIPENAYYMDGNSIVWVGNMNPYKTAVRNWTPTQKHNLSFTDGTDRISYYLSLGYQNQEGMYSINTDEYKRYNASARVNAKIKPWFNVEAKFNYNKTSYTAPYLVGGKGNLWAAMRNETGKNINMPIKTGPNDPVPNAYTDNVLAWLTYGAKTSSISTSTSLAISPEIIVIPKILKLKADLSYLPQTTVYNRHSPQHEYITISWTNPVSEQSEAQDNRARLTRSSVDSYLLNTYADFNKTFADVHNLSVIAGFSQESVTYGALTGDMKGLFSPDIQNPDAAEDITLHTLETGAQKRTGRAVFGRLSYNYKERYLVEMNGRYDGSSRFTPNERYFFFPSFSLGWRITEEAFMAGTKNWLSNLKVRASWGKLGSQPGSYYPYQATMNSASAGMLIDGVWVSTVNAPGLVAPTLTWEKAATTNFGLDAGFVDNKLNMNLDIFERKTTDILTNGNVAYPSVLGASAPLENSGAIKAYGWELALKWNEQLKNGLRYGVELSVYDSRTKVDHYAANPTKNISYLYDGAYTGAIWGYTTGGILQEEDLVKKESGTGYIFNGPYHSGNLYPGYIWYRDINGDGKISGGNSTVEDSGDRRIIGNSTPRYKYSAMGNVGYKGLDFSIFFQGVAKRDIWTGSSAYWGGGAGSQWMYDRSWTPERTDAKFPMYTSGVSTQTGYLLNGAYLRLKQVMLGYTLPQELTKKLGVDRLRFHVAGYNLFEITDIPGVFDPDQISDAYPAKRTVSFGVQVGF